MLPITSATNVRHVESAALNLGPTITNVYSVGSEELEIAIRHHATLRQELEAVFFCAAWRMGVNGQGPLKLNVKIGPARRQIGQATDGNNAAHANSAAGRIDDLAAQYIQIIKSKEELTPQKQDALRGMGISQENIEKLIDSRNTLSCNAEKINQLIFPLTLKAYVFDGTPLDDSINATNDLPYKVNLSTDKGLERRIRSIVAMLITKVMRAEMNPVEAMNEYQKEVLTHFDRKITHYITELASLAKVPQTDSVKHKISQNKEFLYLTLLQNGGTKDFSWNRLFAKYDRVNHRFITPTREDMEQVRGNYISTAKRKLDFKEAPPEVGVPLEEVDTVEDETDLCLAKRPHFTDLTELEPESLSVEMAPVDLKAPSFEKSPSEIFEMENLSNLPMEFAPIELNAPPFLKSPEPGVLGKENLPPSIPVQVVSAKLKTPSTNVKHRIEDVDRIEMRDRKTVYPSLKRMER